MSQNKIDSRIFNILAKRISAITFLIICIALLIVSVVRQYTKESDNIAKAVVDTLKREFKKDNPEIDSMKIRAKFNYPDFCSLQSMQRISIASDFESWTPKGNIQIEKEIKGKLLAHGEIVRAYLYIKVSKDSCPLTNWESIYIKINGHGGHMFRPQSLPIPASSSTEVLFKLDNIPYLSSLPYDIFKTPKTSDWLELINSSVTDNKEINIIAFIASRKKAVIEDISIYYECLNNGDCGLGFMPNGESTLNF